MNLKQEDEPRGWTKERIGSERAWSMEGELWSRAWYPSVWGNWWRCCEEEWKAISGGHWVDANALRSRWVAGRVSDVRVVPTDLVYSARHAPRFALLSCDSAPSSPHSRLPAPDSLLGSSSLQQPFRHQLLGSIANRVASIHCLSTNRCNLV